MIINLYLLWLHRRTKHRMERLIVVNRTVGTHWSQIHCNLPKILHVSLRQTQPLPPRLHKPSSTVTQRGRRMRRATRRRRMTSAWTASCRDPGSTWRGSPERWAPSPGPPRLRLSRRIRAAVRRQRRASSLASACVTAPSAYLTLYHHICLLSSSSSSSSCRRVNLSATLSSPARSWAPARGRTGASRGRFLRETSPSPSQSAPQIF